MFAGLAHGDSSSPSLTHARAVRRSASIHVDGNLDEAAWASAPRHAGFTQRFPKSGIKAELNTSFAVLYDDEAVYIGVWADDPEPDRIRRLLTRRDLDSPGDAILVGIDSYHDKRTAYVFQLNAAGVQRDMMLSNDSKEDWTWDAVWTGDVSIVARGWCAEFRIPLNQLRFSARDTHEWGFQIVRFVSRTKEQATWSPWPRSGAEMVSKFGVLDGIEKLRPGRRLELLPYATGGLEAKPPEAANPLNNELSAVGGLGLDVKYGIGSAFTLLAAVNPDFGQVEADPSQVNLSADELFFTEKRSFFVEGADLFYLPLGTLFGGIEGAFYSRRIGAQPAVLPASYTYIDSPPTATIHSATKLTGKTSGGWSVGVLDAVTAEETATIVDGVERSSPVVSPLTNYAIARVKRDLREGRTTVGVSATAVNRKLDTPEVENVLHDQAYTGGLQLEHRWRDNAWVANLGLVGSYVHGSTSAIERTQRSQVHLAQRPDAAHLRFDPTRTSLAGVGADWVIGRVGDTKHWRVGTGGTLKTSGLELNDAGFQYVADRMVTLYLVEYHDEDPGDHVLNYSLHTDLYTVSTFEPQLAAYGFQCNGSAQLVNYWAMNFGCYVYKGWDLAALRGGPALRADPTAGLNVLLNTDNREPVQLALGARVGETFASSTLDGGVDLGVTIQARSNIDIFVGPSWSRRNDAMQYVAEAADETGTPHYVFARINQITLAMVMRMNWTFSPKLSLQAYAQPFVATGRYSDYKDVTRAGAVRFEDRFDRLEGRALSLMDGTFTASNNGTFQFARPDFSFAQLRSNLVLRWEYRPGSSVFAIWSHGRTAAGDDGRFLLERDLGDLAATRGEDLVMVKVNYWIGL